MRGLWDTLDRPNLLLLFSADFDMAAKRILQWEEDDMCRALAAVNDGTMSIAAASRDYNVPRMTLSDRFHKVSINAKVGRPGALAPEDEAALVKLIDRHNLILLNDSVHTRFDTYHHTSSLLDLSLCHPSIYMDVACEISSDRIGSDHHPIIITANTSDHPVPERVPKWNFKKAKWDAFQDQCITEITPDLFNDAEDKMAIFSSTLLSKKKSQTLVWWRLSSS